jgi:hypothetical protein
MTDKDYLPQYAAELVHDLEIQKKYWRYSANAALKRWGKDNPVYKEEASKADAFEMTADMVRNAVHIVLPLNGQVYVPASVAIYTPEECESSHALPHVLTTFEHAADKNYFTVSDADEYPDAMVTLAVDFKQNGDEPEKYINPKLPDRYPVAMMGFYRFSKCSNTDTRWVLNNHYMTMYTPLVYTNGGTQLGLSCVYTKEGLYDSEHKPTVSWDVADEIHTSLNGNMETVVRACHAMRVGAVLEERQEKSYTRNRTFQKKGVGGFEYHVLRLPHGTVKETLGSRSGGERDGPRYHFRRAHLRNLSKGTQTCVRSCFVGNREKGEIKKEYKLEPGAAA